MNETLNKIIEQLEINSCFSDADVEKLNMDYKRFYELVTTIQDYCLDNKKFLQEDENIFENYTFFLEYKDIQFRLFAMYGQGSFYIFRLCKRRDLNKNYFVNIKNILGGDLS